jgi:hypothetical protein
MSICGKQVGNIIHGSLRENPAGSRYLGCAKEAFPKHQYLGKLPFNGHTVLFEEFVRV